MKKILALADCNNFFVSCEILKNPSLKNKPVCVLSNCDGCVISRSQEAKDLGIPMGMPLFMAKEKFPEAIYLSGDMKTYHNISQRVQKVLKDFAQDVEICSIDEAFLDVTNLYKLYNVKGYLELAELLHKKLLKEVGIPVSVGIANSKILCKIATDFAKKNSFYYFIPEEKIFSEIENYPIEKIWGIGKSTASLLKADGIFFAQDIVNKNKEFFEHYLGKKGLEIKFGIAGENTIPIKTIEEKPKSIQKTASFKSVTNDKMFLKNEILEHLHSACKKMRKYDLIATEITVMLRTKDFKIISLTDTITTPTNAEYILNKKAIELFEQIYSKFNLYRSSGVYLGGLKDNEIKQLKLLDDTEKFDKISQIWDKIEATHGKGFFNVGIH